MKKNRVRLHVNVETSSALRTDWTFDDPLSVTLGYSPSSLVWLMDPTAGSSRTVFERKGGKTILRIGPGLTGHLTLDGKDVPFSTLQEIGLLHEDGEGNYVGLRKQTTGKISLGNSTIRFWISESPAEPEFPLHPLIFRIFRGSPLLLMLMLLFSSSFHVWLVDFVRKLPPPPPPSIHEFQRKFARFSVPESDYVKKYEARRQEGPGKAEKPEPPSRNIKKLAQTPGGLLAAVVSKRSDTQDSPFSNLFTTSSLGKDLDSVLGGATLDDAIAERLKGGPSNISELSKAPEAVKIGSLKGTSLQDRALEKKTTSIAVSKLSIDAPDIQGVLDRSQLERLVSSKSGQLRECYERGLSRNRDLSGKVVVSLIITENGKPASVAIDQSTLNDRSVERCITGRIAKWIFPKPVGGDTPVRFPFIFSASSRG